MLLLHQVWMIFDKTKKEGIQTDHTTIWDRWIESGLSITTSFQEMKSITQFEGLYELYYFLHSCQEITNIIDIKWENKILFRLATTNKNADATDSVKSVPSATSSETRYDGDINALEQSTVISHTTTNPPGRGSTDNTTKQDKVTSTDLTIPQLEGGDNPTEWDILETAGMESYTIDTIELEQGVEFMLFHSYLYDVVNQWRLKHESHPLAIKWKKWILHGLARDNNYRMATKTLGVTSFSGYLQALLECPAIEERVVWEWQDDKLRYWIIQETPDTEPDIKQTPAKILSMRSDLQVFANKFDLTIKDVNNKLKEALFRLDILDERSRRHSRTIERNIHAEGQRIMQEQGQTLRRITENLIAEQRVQMEQIAKEAYGGFKSDTRAVINTFDAEVASKVETFKQHLDRISVSSVAASQETLGSTLVKLVDDLHKAATEVTVTLTTMAEEKLEAIRTSSPTATAAEPQNRATTPHPLFPNVDRTKIRDFNPTNPFIDPPVTTGAAGRRTAGETNNEPAKTAYPDIRDPTASPKQIQPQYAGNWAPQSYQGMMAQYPYGQFQEPPIPYLQYDNVMKRAQAQFTGEEDILVFYNQLRNGVAHYGLYLIEVPEFALGKSLCPESYQGHPIDDARYKLMAGCLYQKLVSFDTIPAEFSQARTTINTYAEANDGYKVLYAMIEPLLQMDDIPTPPRGDEWPNIHEYATKFQSWKNCEALKGRSFTPKELTKTFLNGLNPVYRPAISRARSVLDNRGQADPTVPDDLKLLKLPGTMNRWLKEETGQGVVRATYDIPQEEGIPTIRAAYSMARRQGQKQETGDRYRTPSHNHIKDSKTLKTDKQCPICLVIGHHKTQCLLYGRYLACREADQRADDAMRTKVTDHFRTEAKRKAERGRKREQLGTVRQMWAEGRSFEEIESTLLMTMPELETPASSDSENDE